jgi:hypothetical protein
LELSGLQSVSWLVKGTPLPDAVWADLLADAVKAGIKLKS